MAKQLDHKQLDIFWENPSMMVVYMNSTGKVINSSIGLQKYLASELITNIYNFEKKLNIIKTHIDITLQSGFRSEKIDLEDENGNVKTAIFQSSVSADGNIISFLTDVTKEIESLNNFSHNSSLLEVIKSSSKIGVWTYNIGSKDLVWDKEMFQMYSMNEKDGQGKFEDWMSLLSEEDAEITRKRFKDSIEGCRELKTNFKVETDQGTKYFELKGEVFRENGRAVQITGVNEDITEKFLHEKKLMDTMQKLEENNRLKTAFLQNISHEIRTPLNGIIGFSKLLIGDTFDEEEKVEFINLITSSSLRLLDVVDNIIDLSKVETNQIELDKKDFSANGLIEDIYIFFRNNFDKEHIKFNYHININYDVEVTSDPKILNKIILHLLSNAQKFTHEGEINFGYELKEDECIFFVEDTGIGISDTDKDKIFESFVQGDNRINRDYEGAGLGLTISKHFIDLLGGKIWFESELGKGTKFFISVPSNNQEKQPEQTEEKPDNKVLVVEDDNASFTLLRILLKKNNFTAIRANNGVEAVNKVLEEKDYKIVLMDMKMPVMNGYEATKKIRETNKKIPIIAVTADALEVYIKKALDAGCNDHVPKPIDANILLQKITKYLA